MDNYTIIYTNDGKVSYCTCRQQYSIKEFGGFCESCWVKLTAAERAALKGTELPQVEVVLKYYPKRPFAFAVYLAGFVWKVAITALVGLLLYRDGLIAESVQYFHQHVHLHHLFR